MQSEDAISLMCKSSSSSGTTPEEVFVYENFNIARLKVDRDDAENKRYTLQFDNYEQKVVDLGNRLILVDNVLTLDTDLRSAMYDGKLRQAIDYVSGGINIV